MIIVGDLIDLMNRVCDWKNETMIDKETCEKVIEAANAITASAKEVRHLVRDVKEVVAIGAESVRTLLLYITLSLSI